MVWVGEGREGAEEGGIGIVMGLAGCCWLGWVCSTLAAGHQGRFMMVCCLSVCLSVLGVEKIEKTELGGLKEARSGTSENGDCLSDAAIRDILTGAC